MLTLVWLLDIYDAVWGDFPPFYFCWPLVIGVVFLIKSTWHSAGDNIKTPSMLEVVSSVKEEGRFPSVPALPPRAHLTGFLLSPFVATFVIQIDQETVLSAPSGWASAAKSCLTQGHVLHGAAHI